MPSERHRHMGVGLNSPANKRKSAPRGTFTLHKNSVDEENPVAPFQEYPKYIAEADQTAEHEAHEAQIRADLEKKTKSEKKTGKGEKDAA